MKNKKILCVMGLAIILCLLSACGVYMLLSPQRATVYVFREDYTAGTQVTRDILMPIEIDATIIEMGGAADVKSRYVTSEEYADVLQNSGTLCWDVTQGTTLMKSMLTSYGGSKVEMTMKPSSIAVTVSSDYLSAVTNELSSGAYVNIYASYDEGAQTKLILQNIRVLTVPKVDGVLAGVTLEVNHEQSLKLVHAINYGKITFGLVNSQGYQYTVEEQPTYDIGGFSVGADISAAETPPAENDKQDDIKESQDTSKAKEQETPKEIVPEPESGE